MLNNRDFFRTNGHKNSDYSNLHLLDVGGKGLIFEECDFSYSVLERAYFHNAKFVRCKFIGARFLACNFRSASFDRCLFEYSTFDQTFVDEQQVVLNLPLAPNQKRDLIRSLRANASSMGDFEAHNALLSLEMRASVEHYGNILKYNNAYYRNKYPKKARIGAFFKHYGLRIEDFIWGYGISPSRLVVMLFLFVSFLGVVLSFTSDGWPSSGSQFLNSMVNGIAYAHMGLLDLGLLESTLVAKHRILFSVIVGVRTIALGLFVSVLYRRYAR